MWITLYENKCDEIILFYDIFIWQYVATVLYMLTVLQFIYKTSYIYSFLVNGVAVINPSDVLSFDFSINNQNLYAFTHFKVFRLRRKTLLRSSVFNGRPYCYSSVSFSLLLLFFSYSISPRCVDGFLWNFQRWSALV